MAQPSAFVGTGIYNTPFLQVGPQGRLINLISRVWAIQFRQLAAQLISPVTANVPATAAAPGVFGQIATDGNYLYVCVATNTWKRVAIAAF
jgi:hypothetical protein